MRSSNYAFATGKIRYLETKLLNLTDIERMIGAPSAEKAFKALYDTDYADNLSDVPVQEFEKAIREDLKQTKDLLIEIIPDKDFLKLLLLEYDFFNLKVIFKEKLFQKDLSHLLHNLGFFTTDDLKKIVFENKREEKSREIEEVINQANSIFNEKSEPYKIEFFFDKKYFLLLESLAKKLKNKFIINFVKLKINLINLRIFLRLKKIGLTVDFLKEVLIEGGEITIEDFVNLYDQDLPFILNKLEKRFPFRFSKYFSEYSTDGKFWQLEKKLFEEELGYLKKSKYMAFGPEIVITYFYAKKSANKNARLIMSGKINQIDLLTIKERVRKTY